MRNRRRLGAALTMAVGITVLAGCSRGVTHGSASVRSSSNRTAGSSASPAVPNPFTIIARYSGASLGLKDPADLAIGPDGNLYIVDANQHVTVVSARGSVLRRWGQPGTGPGQFDFIMPGGPSLGRPVTVGIAGGPDGEIYVSDSGNARIQVFTSTGAFVRQFRAGKGSGEGLVPGGLAVDSRGGVYVSVDGLWKFSRHGDLLWRIGGSQATDPDLRGPLGMASAGIDRHGGLLIANDVEGRVLHLDANGRKLDAFGEGSQEGRSGTFRDGVCNVTVDAAGYIFVNSCQEALISPHYTEVFDRNHRLVGTWYPSGIGLSPRFGPNGEVFTIGEDGSILRLKVALPND